ncbi:MAG: hypothetical protein HRT88_14950, partial [Lentisphaeraceae bacterium]|nr:hypothetical protein [Lentisphaeraceae bacterium]
MINRTLIFSSAIFILCQFNVFAASPIPPKPPLDMQVPTNKLKKYPALKKGSFRNTHVQNHAFDRAPQHLADLQLTPKKGIKKQKLSQLVLIRHNPARKVSAHQGTNSKFLKYLLATDEQGNFYYFTAA